MTNPTGMGAQVLHPELSFASYPERILVPVDFSTESRRAVEMASAIALQSGADVHLLYVDSLQTLSAGSPEAFTIPEHWLSKLRPHHEEQVRQSLSKLADDFSPATVNVRYGEVVPTILSAADSVGADLMVLGSHGRGATAFLLGHTAERVARAAKCPVLVARGEGPSKSLYQKVMVGVDYGSQSVTLARCAAALAARDGQVELVHVWEGPTRVAHSVLMGEERDRLADIDTSRGLEAERLMRLAQSTELPPDRVATHLAEGEPSRTLLAHAVESNADLICLGTRPPADAWDRALGNTAERVLRHADVPVLLVPRGADNE